MSKIKLYGIQISYPYEEVGGRHKSILRKLHTHIPDQLTIDSVVKEWKEKLLKNKNFLTVDFEHLETEVIDFDLTQKMLTN